MDRINTPSVDFEYMSTYWEKVNTIIEGTEAMRDAGNLYLPQFPEETDMDYLFRLKNARFTNIYVDILEGLASKPFSRQLSLSDDSNDLINEFIRDVDGRGNNLHVFSAETFYDGINNAIDWILVEYTKPEQENKTKEDEKKSGVRPYWVHIPATSVINIESKVIKGREQLTNIRILENDKRIREFDRTQDLVVWRIHEDLGDKQWVVTSEGDITIGVIPMVPFITGRRKGNTWRFKPPMQDSADLQIELYQQESGIKNIKNLTCFPMLAGNGIQPEMNGQVPKKVPVGPHSVLYAPPNSQGGSGQWKWLEPSAETLKFLQSDINDTKRDLRELGRQPLTANSGNLTVITTAFAAQKGNSAVQAWALALGVSLDLAIQYTAMWLSIDTEIPKTVVFTDFGIDEQEEESLKTLLEMRKPNEDGGVDLSRKTFWSELKRRGTLSADFDSDTELQNIVNEVSNLKPDSDEEGATLD